MRSGWKLVRRILMFLMIFGLFTPQNVRAAGQIDPGKDVSLRIEYQGKKESVAGIRVWLYKVAELNEYDEFELVGDFADYPVEINGLDSEGFRLLAETLEINALKDRIPAYDETTVNDDGIALFPATKAKMEQGLYLVLSQNYIEDGQIFAYTPILISLPHKDVNGEWAYGATIHPKNAPKDEETSLSVVKVWKGDEKKRPESIEVELLKDGAVYETITLNEDNNWRYEWKNLEKADWKVAEKKVPDGYTVTITKDQTGYVITNTTEEPPTTPPPNNPQTGVLWWPVPILAGVGMIFFMIGWIRRRRFEA